MDKAYQQLIDELIEEGYLRTPAYVAAFRTVVRRDFLPDGMAAEAAVNTPLSIGSNQTISQPLTVAFMLELLNPQPGNRVLDVGSGSGWTTALLAHVVGPRGHVYAIERIPELHRFGQRNVAKFGFGHVTMVCGDGSVGLPEHAPFDRIQVAAAAGQVPQPLLDQLAVGGRMVIPTQADDLRLVVRKSNNRYDTKVYPGFVFVPFIEEQGAGSRRVPV